MKMIIGNHGVPDTIRQLMADKGMETQTVAERAGMSMQKLEDMMHNRRLIRIQDVVSLAHALECAPNAFFDGSYSG